MQLDVDLNGFPHPSIDGSVLPVVDDPVDLVGTREGVGVAEAAIALVHDGKVDLGIPGSMVAHLHLRGGEDEASGYHPAFSTVFLQSVSQWTVLHSRFTGGKNLSALGSMKEVPVGETVGASLAQDHLRFPGVEEPGHVEAGHPVLAGKKVDEALAGSALAALGHPSIVPWPTFDKTVKRPAFSTIETNPDPDVLAPG